MKVVSNDHDNDILNVTFDVLSLDNGMVLVQFEELCYVIGSSLDSIESLVAEHIG